MPTDKETTREQQLKELIDTWRYEYEQAAGSGGYLYAARAFEKCADELEQVMN